MPKPKHVKHATPFPSTPYNTAQRELDVMELATSFVDEHGPISEPESQMRVFRAAVVGGVFRVNRKIKGGVMDTLTYRHYPQAMAVYVKLWNEGQRPMLYATNNANKDTMLAAHGYKDSKTGKYVSTDDATAEMLLQFLAEYNRITGAKFRPATKRKRKTRVRIRE